jgi:hypothetical protein
MCMLLARARVCLFARACLVLWAQADGFAECRAGTIVASFQALLVSPTGLISASEQGYHSDRGPGRGVCFVSSFHTGTDVAVVLCL